MNVITNNGVYTKEIAFRFKSFEFGLGIRSLRWIRHWIKGELSPKLFEHSKKVTSFKRKSAFIQKVRKQYRFPLFIIEWTITKTHDRHKAYSYYHHKRYLRIKTRSRSRLLNEIRFYLKKAGFIR
jgi:hypothetical protein